MFGAVLKVLLSATIIVVASELAKRSAAVGALVASLPMVALLSMIWLWRETGDRAGVAGFAGATFWYVLPSLPMFLLIPALLRAGMSFWLSTALGVAVTVVLYLLTRAAVARFGLAI